MRPITDDFSSPNGRWIDYWTQTGDGDYLWIDKLVHVDLRSFINLNIERPRTQDEMDQYSQTLLQLNPPLGTQANLESKRIVAGESWELSGTGLGDLYVGIGAGTDGLRVLTATANGSAIDADFISRIENDGDPVTAPIDGSEGALGVNPYLILTFDPSADITLSDLTAAASYVQLSSNTDGSFSSGNQVGDAPETGESAKVSFSTSTGGADWVALSVGDMLRDSFDPTAITGIRIHVEKASSTNGDKVTLLQGVKIVDDPMAYADNSRDHDFDTRRGVIRAQVGPSGVRPLNGLNPLLRGTEDNGADDPRFVDGAIGIHFCSGGADPAGSAGNNFVNLIARDDGSSFIVSTTLGWDVDGNVSYTVVESSSSETVGPVDWGITLDRAVDEDVINGRGIDADAGMYYFQMSVIGSLVELRLYESSAECEIGALLAEAKVPNPHFKAKLGRCGFYINFADYDAYISKLEEGTVGYGTLRTLAFKSPTPVDAVQIVANTTPDIKLSQDLIWINPAEEFLDSTKTKSGNPSYRTTSGLMTSNFLVEDWKHSYIKAWIWVGSNVSYETQPYVLMESTSLDENDEPIQFRINLERLQPSQWNEIYIDLLPYRNAYANLFYRLSVLVPQDAGIGAFWVDDLTVGQRTIEWEARTEPGNPWRSFRGLVNDPFGGIHFPPEERGRNLQIQATALTPTAKIINYKLIPRYAELGAPLYDRAYRSR